MSDDAKAFGQLVRRRRKALKLTQEALAATALDNLDRKGMISQIENGRIPNITRETVKKVALALSIDVEDIPASLRWSEAAKVVKDTNTVVHELQATTEKLAGLLSAQAQSFRIKEGLLIALARRYAEGSPGDFDAAYAGLEHALEVAAQDRERGRLPSNTDDAVDAVIAQVDKLNGAGNIDIAAVLLAEQEARARAGLIRLCDKGIAQSVLTRDIDAAVRYELKKLPIEAPEPDKAYTYLRGVFIGWRTRGTEKGLNFDAEVALELIRHMAQRFKHDQDKKRFCLNNLGHMLQALGERETNKERLEEAIAAHRAALKELTREHEPGDWAKSQVNLGNALRALGTRETGTEQLEESISAYRAALSELSFDHVPLDWAMTQMNLGNALFILGVRKTDCAGLEKAIAAHRAALKVYSREREPFEWAKTQLNLGSSLAVLGEREVGTEKLENAIAAYQAGLEECTRDRVPLEWAMTQMNLGNALQTLWERESGIERLEEAIAAYRAALEENTRDRVPLDWATTQMNLGTALRKLGGQESGIERLEEAIAAYRAALEEYTRDHLPIKWAHASGNEAVTLVILADRTDDAERAALALDQMIESEISLREYADEAGAQAFAAEILKAQSVVAGLSGIVKAKTQ